MKKKDRQLLIIGSGVVALGALVWWSRSRTLSDDIEFADSYPSVDSGDTGGNVRSKIVQIASNEADNAPRSGGKVTDARVLDYMRAVCCWPGSTNRAREAYCADFVS